MLKLPYGTSNFSQIANENYYFVDRTPYIAQLEELPERYFFFLRPRRFGKSVFVSMLQCYYGLEYAPHFDELFGRFFIGQQPTPLANQYLVLKLDFSHISTRTSESTFAGFLDNVKFGLRDFLTAYPFCFQPEDEAYILEGDNPTNVLSRFFSQFKRRQSEQQTNHKIYLLIDEYDHFANELVAFRLDEFKNSVSRTGYVRKFYERIKTATGDGTVDRIFITGVSPVTLDSLTSGFNIGTHLTLDLLFHNMMGFTEAEVAEILIGVGVANDVLPTVLDDIRQWYNGYLFNGEAQKRLYNPDMVLYFASRYGRHHAYPEELLDINIASDYGKLRQLFRVEGQEAQNLAVLHALITNGHVAAQLTQQFSFEKDFTNDDLISILFYLGIVTIKQPQLSRYIFEPPNFVITQLYFRYFQQLILQQAALRADDLHIYDRVLQLAQDNNTAPLIEAVEMILLQLSNRDAVGFDEKYVKAVFASLLYSTQIYTVHSEYETTRRYVDLLLTRRPPIDPSYQFAFELKYLKLAEADQLESKTAEALTQMQDYLQHDKLRALTDLRAWIIVFVGPKAQLVQSVQTVSA